MNSLYALLVKELGLPDGEGLTRFDITPVARFMYEDTDQEYFDWRQDFPSIVPPFPAMWMEFSAPRFLRSEGIVEPWPVPGMKAGVALMTVDSERREAVERMMNGLTSIAASGEKPPPGFFDFRWLITATCFQWAPGMAATHVVPATIFIPLDEQGQSMSEYHYAIGTAPTAYAGRSTGDQAFTHFMPFALALSFLHCKNVSIVDLPDDRSRQVRRADERRGAPVYTFKTLQIGPMRQVLETEGGLSRNGLQRALHICRGHFAEYTPEKPLFGKYSGRFWIPAHVRGSADVGRIVKDYRVVPPAQNGEAA